MVSWPLWATVPCILLALALFVLHIFDKWKANSAAVKDAEKKGEYKHFQRQYLTVYFLIMFADWLQGTHMYSLYESYGVHVGSLFLTGFLSSAFFGSFLGPYVDHYGRRNACFVYCILEILINLLEEVPSYPVLFIGRIIGGVSTSLLFSAFESWAVTAHRSKGFPESFLSQTFSIASEGNGLLAVVAGLVAQVAADTLGEIGPFRVAVAVTAMSIMWISRWEENYATTLTKEEPNLQRKWFQMSWQVYALGLCCSLFDGAMYIFVFLWYPTLQPQVPNQMLPSGVVFSAFMLSLAIGGKLHTYISSTLPAEVLLVAISFVSTIALLIPSCTSQYEWLLLSFLVFEVCVGLFSPCAATLRSRYFPSEYMSTALSIFRLPTNIIVVMGIACTEYYRQEVLFGITSVVMAIATTLAWKLLRFKSKAE